jgi:hypothetical protein
MKSLYNELKIFFQSQTKKKKKKQRSIRREYARQHLLLSCLNLSNAKVRKRKAHTHTQRMELTTNFSFWSAQSSEHQTPPRLGCLLLSHSLFFLAYYYLLRNYLGFHKGGTLKRERICVCVCVRERKKERCSLL